MELLAARLLTIFLTIIAATVPRISTFTTESPISSTTANQINETIAASLNPTPSGKLIDYARPFANVKDILMQEIHDLDKDTPDAKVRCKLYIKNALHSKLYIVSFKNLYLLICSNKI